MVGSDHIDAFSRLTRVSRETISSLAKYEEILKQGLSKVNQKKYSESKSFFE